MLPHDLKAESFTAYPADAKALILSHLDVIRQLPLAFVPSLLRQIMEYDYSFPIERSAVERELKILGSLSAAQRLDWFGGFTAISLSSDLENSDWIHSPAQFVEQESAYLWSTHQLDAFRKAATEYGYRLEKEAQPQPPAMQRCFLLEPCSALRCSVWELP